MLLALFLSTIGCHVWLARAAPLADTDMNTSPACPDNNPGLAWTGPEARQLIQSQNGPNDCAAGGICDCSKLKDKNGSEYFQCVTNPNCERCWLSPTTSKSTATMTFVASQSPTIRLQG